MRPQLCTMGQCSFTDSSSAEQNTGSMTSLQALWELSSLQLETVKTLSLCHNGPKPPCLKLPPLVCFFLPPPPPPAPPYIKNKVCLLKKLFLLVNECLIVPSLAVALPGNSGCLTAYLGKILQPQEQRYSFQSLSLSQYQCIRYFRVSR